MKISTQLVPAFASTLLTRIAVGVGVSAVAIAITSVIGPQPTLAQSAQSVQPLQDFTTQQNEQDALSGTSGSGDFSVLDLIHRAQMGSIRDMDEFSAEQNQNITDAAAKFRLEQQQRLGIQQEIPVNQVPNSPAGN